MMNRPLIKSTDYAGNEDETVVDVGLSKDAMFKMLSNRRRRLAVQFLQQQPDNRMQIRELSRLIAAKENETTPEEVTYKQRKRVYISLYQTHLSALHDNGIVEYDARSGTITLKPAARDFSRYLDVSSGRELGWGEAWLALGAVCLAFGIATWTRMLPYFGVRPDIAVLLLSVVVFVSTVTFYLSVDRIRL